MSHLLVIFASIFLAELGDKTQLATLLYASEGERSPVAIFIAASLALVASTALAVLLGTAAREYLEAVPLKLIAGIGFVAIGLWTIYGHYQAA